MIIECVYCTKRLYVGFATMKVEKKVFVLVSLQVLGVLIVLA